MKPDYKAAHVTAEFDHPAPLITCRFDPTGRFVFATAEDRAILRWELADPKQKAVFTAHDSYVWAVAFSKDGQTLVSAGGDDTLMWWPATGRSSCRSAKSPRTGVGSARSPSARTASGSPAAAMTGS